MSMKLLKTLQLGLLLGVAVLAPATRAAPSTAGQFPAARALDFDTTTTWRRIVLPQALKPMLPVLGNYLIGMFKETPLLAVISIPELFQAAKQIAGMTYHYNEPYTVMALMFLAISVPTSLLFKHFERRGHV